MSDEEDFISLWKKKRAEPSAKPSVIGETIDKLNKTEDDNKSLKQENIDLKEKIKQNIDLLTKTENIIKEGIEERKRLEREKNEAIEALKEELNTMEANLDELRSENSSLRAKLSEVEDQIKTKEMQYEAKIDVLKKAMGSSQAAANDDLTLTLQAEVSDLKDEVLAKEMLIGDLQEQIQGLKNSAQIMGQAPPQQPDTEERESLVLFLQNKVNEQDKKIAGYESKVKEISSKNEELMLKVVSTEKETTQEVSDTQTLDLLCQDLQAELNKYKRVVKTLKDKNSELQKQVEGGGAPQETVDTKALEKENKNLKKQLEKLSKKAPKEPNNQEVIDQLKQHLAQKEETIRELKSSSSTSTGSGGVPEGLVDDLQNKLNKYKVIIKKLKDENANLKG